MEPITMEALTQLYQSVGWLAYTQNQEKMAKILPGSLWYLAAFHQKKLVGLVRVVGDDCSIAYVQDLLVHPDYQRQGIGRALMEGMAQRFAHIRQVVLMTDNEEKNQAFYQSLGMKKMEDTGALGFVKYNT